MKVNFYATFRPIVGGKTVFLPLPEGSTVAVFLQILFAQYPALMPQMLDEHGNLFAHVHVFVNGRDVQYLNNGFETVLSESDSLDIFPPVGGG
jgi:MoaD family protein